MTPEQERKLNEVYQFMGNLKMSSKIPLAVDQAFTGRGYVKDVSVLTVSSKGVDTEDVSINEGGVGSHIVMNDPDGFLQVTIGLTTYYIPYFT